ncbi:hypothetical protein ANO14919_040630 [Xylariales sp. No.14919]|nr:hypothetical protein ANO14919_040630 [Xylariales sp. No.14919]
MQTARTDNYSTAQDAILLEISIALGTSLSDLDLESSFIQNGGDSLSSVKLQLALEKHGIRIPINNIFTANSIQCFAEESSLRPLYGPNTTPLHDVASDRRRKHIDSSMSLPGHSSKSYSIIMAPENRASTRCPLTEMQISLVQSTQLNPGYNVISYSETHLPENVPALKLAWETVLRMEEIFNVSFCVDESGVYSYERRQMPFVWEELVFQDQSSYEQELEISRLQDQPVGTTFKVVTFAPLGANGKSTVVWRVHHAMIDGMSCSIVLSKVRQVLAQKPVKAGPPFGIFSSKLQSLQLREYESAVEFWAKQKRDHPSPSTELLLRCSSNDQTAHLGIIDQVYIKSDLMALKETSKAAEVTLASLYCAAWGLVLSSYTNSNSVLFGAILSSRSLPIEGIQSIVGPLINALPLSISINPSSTIRDYLRCVFSALMELASFHWTMPRHGFTRNFSTAVSVRFDVPEPSSAPFSPLEPPHSIVCSDIPLSIDVGNCGRICLSYHTKCFSRVSIERLAGVFTTAIESISDIDSTLASCLGGLVNGHHRFNLAKVGNWSAKSTRHGYIKDDLVSLFVQATERNPYLSAVEHRSDSLTYIQLHKQSSHIARILSDFVLPGDIVCVRADESINWIIAIFAVLKAGAVYCPLVPNLPKAAREANFTAADAKLYLSTDTMAKSSQPASCEICLSVEELLSGRSSQTDNSPGLPQPTANGYLCFTSGTTGKPKGVLCRHESLVAFQSDFRVRLCAQPGWRIAQFMSLEFDGSIHEIFSALCYGATLVLKDSSRPFDHLKRCDAAILTPSVAKALDPSEFPDLKTLYLVGEAVDQSVCEMWAGQRQLFNMYGPTEATCGATIKSLATNKPVTLGVPNPSSRVYILDSHQKLVPFGVIGEIYLAGIQVATGYIGEPTETRLKFLPDSVNPQFEGEFMYKTGDRAYWNEQGELMFLGRRDRQVKLRGFRIDLDDLEAKITKACNNCTAAAVAVKDDYIVALVQPAHLDPGQVGSQIRNHIPAYALPRHIVAVKSFPTTPIGKLDYKAIASITYQNSGPATSLNVWKEMIISALREIIGICADEYVDPESAFADLGVNSLVALHLSQGLSRSFKLRIPIGMVLGTTTVKSLAEALSRLQVPEIRHINSALGDHGVSPIEAEWWHKYHKRTDTSSFNVTYACELLATPLKPRLFSAWNTVLRQHRLLRCRYVSTGLSGLRREYAPLPPLVKLVDTIDVQREINIPFNLESDDLIRVFLSPTHMLVVVSHIICDLTTLGLLLHQVAEALHGRQPTPVAKVYSQTTWSIPASPHHLSFWSSYLSRAPEPNLPVGNIGRRRKQWTGSSYSYQIPENIHEAMNRFATTEKVTMQQIALASVALALQHKNDYCDITIGAPYLNRHSQDDLDVVGLFLEPLPIRIHYDPTRPDYPNSKTGTTMSEFQEGSFIKTVQRSSEQALSHAVAWDQLLAHLNLTPDFPNHPIFDVVVTFHEATQTAQLCHTGIRSLPTWSEGAKFKLMAEFTANEEGELSLRLEYSDECFTAEDIRIVTHLVFGALNSLVSGDDYGMIVRHLRRMSDFQALLGDAI